MQVLTAPRAILAAIAAVTAAFSITAPAGPEGLAPDPLLPPDIPALVAEARRVQKRDVAAWRLYRFHRLVRTDRLGAGGEVVSTRAVEFEVMPAAEGFDEQLVAIDGRHPTPEEVAAARRERAFDRHYATLVTEQEEKHGERGYSMATLLHQSSYLYAGREVVEALPCHRLDFGPGERQERGGIIGRILGATAGSLWLTTDGLHMIRARSRSVRPVSFPLGLSKLYHLDVSFEAGQVAPDIYLPQRIEVVTSARVLVSIVHRRQVFTYSAFVR